MPTAAPAPGRRLALALAVFSLGFVAPVLLAQQPLPRPPHLPNLPPASTFGPRPGIPNINPPGGLNQREWVCEKCGHVLSRGAPAPVGTVCPGCGAVITGIDFNPNAIGPVNPGGINPPVGFAPPAGSTPPAASVPPMGVNPPVQPANAPAPVQPANVPAPFNPPPANSAPVSSPNIPPSTASPAPSFGPTPSSLGTVIVGVVIVLTGLAVLGGAACLIIYNVVRNSAPPRRRRRLIDYDD